MRDARREMVGQRPGREIRFRAVHGSVAVSTGGRAALRRSTSLTPAARLPDMIRLVTRAPVRTRPPLATRQRSSAAGREPIPPIGRPIPVRAMTAMSMRFAPVPRGDRRAVVGDLAMLVCTRGWWKRSWIAGPRSRDEARDSGEAARVTSAPRPRRAGGPCFGPRRVAGHQRKQRVECLIERVHSARGTSSRRGARSGGSRPRSASPSRQNPSDSPSGASARYVGSMSARDSRNARGPGPRRSSTSASVMMSAAQGLSRWSGASGTSTSVVVHPPIQSLASTTGRRGPRAPDSRRPLARCGRRRRRSRRPTRRTARSLHSGTLDSDRLRDYWLTACSRLRAVGAVRRRRWRHVRAVARGRLVLGAPDDPVRHPPRRAPAPAVQLRPSGGRLRPCARGVRRASCSPTSTGSGAGRPSGRCSCRVHDVAAVGLLARSFGLWHHCRSRWPPARARVVELLDHLGDVVVLDVVSPTPDSSSGTDCMYK